MNPPSHPLIARMRTMGAQVEHAGAAFAPGFPTRNVLIGRRDWDRTNDPHHVKVVLYH
jgi:hypothetical protein